MPLHQLWYCCYLLLVSVHTINSWKEYISFKWFALVTTCDLFSVDTRVKKSSSTQHISKWDAVVMAIDYWSYIFSRSKNALDDTQKMPPNIYNISPPQIHERISIIVRNLAIFLRQISITSATVDWCYYSLKFHLYRHTRPQYPMYKFLRPLGYTPVFLLPAWWMK